MTNSQCRVIRAARVRWGHRLRTLRTGVIRDRLRLVRAMPEPEIVSRKGKPVTVIISIKEYQELLERVEDSEDVAGLKTARRKPLHCRPFDEFQAE